MAIKPKSMLVLVARLLFIPPIITSRELLSTHLASTEALLCTCRKEPSVLARSRKCPHTVPFTYRNGIHASSRCMDSVQPWIRSFWNEADPCLAYSQCRTSTYGKTWRDIDVMVGSLWIRSHPSLA
jgi:hypothetical protein